MKNSVNRFFVFPVVCALLSTLWLAMPAAAEDGVAVPSEQAMQSEQTAPSEQVAPPEQPEQPEQQPVQSVQTIESEVRQEEKRTLDMRVQDLKKEVKTLNRDLFILEEELLFPASTQLAVFLSLDVGNFFRLDSVQLKIDDKVVANHLYTQRELEALKRGGVQRLYIGNVKSGEHELIATFHGPGPNNREYRRGTTVKFKKDSAAKFMELKIVDVSEKLQPEFVVKEWE